MTRFQYAGKSWDDKRLAADDGGSSPSCARRGRRSGRRRPRLCSPTTSSRACAAPYHLYPANVAALKGVQALLPAASFRPGDVLVLYRKRGVQYDAARKDLRWDETQSLKADLVHFSGGSAVFRVLPPG
jgi:hypothetical protein